MHCYIAFLRAINVGGRNVKMEQLKQLFLDCSFTDVDTFIASGNVIFASEQSDINQLQNEVETHLHKALGYSVATFIRTIEAINAIAKQPPFEQTLLDSAKALNVAFLQQPLNNQAQAALQQLGTDIDFFHYSDTEIYWLCKAKQSDSKFSNIKLEKQLNAKVTFRTINTVYRLSAKYGGPSH